MPAHIKKILWLSLFAIAMGYLETSVVVYLRALYYPDGFSFPLKGIPPFIARVEFFREAATVIMLIGCGYLAGKNRLQRFAFFVLAFAIWDLFYYVFLVVTLAWPESLFTWDILFLIPVPWVGPVWSPILLSVLMIFGSVYIIFKTEHNPAFKITRTQWWLMLSGVLLCMLAFMWDYVMQSHQTWSVFSGQELFSELRTYVPQQFNSPLFFCGFGLMVASLVINSLKSNQK
ncbi:MAG: hypothetical protein IT236_17105 [Bacteroidia bacterium]|nr:hypothetical protein [Bacteroidia bacterium]